MRRLLLTLVTVAALTGAGLVTAGPAAAASCTSAPSRANCDTKEPYAEGCNIGSYVVDNGFAIVRNSKGDHVAVVALVWSPRCRTNWSYMEPSGSTTRTMQAEVDRCDSYSVGGALCNVGRFYGGKVYNARDVHSAMTYAP